MDMIILQNFGCPSDSCDHATAIHDLDIVQIMIRRTFVFYTPLPQVLTLRHHSANLHMDFEIGRITGGAGLDRFSFVDVMPTIGKLPRL